MKQQERIKLVKLGSGITTIQELNKNGSITIKIGEPWKKKS